MFFVTLVSGILWLISLFSCFSSSPCLSSDPSLSGVNYTNILHEAFTCADPKSAKKTDSLTVIFGLLGFAHVKAARKMMVKLTPGAGVRT